MKALSKIPAVVCLLLVCAWADADTYRMEAPSLIGTFTHGQSAISAYVDFGDDFAGVLSSVQVTGTGLPGESAVTGAFDAELLVSVYSLNGTLLIGPTVFGPYGQTPGTYADGIIHADAVEQSGGTIVQVVIETNDIYADVTTPSAVDIQNVTVWMEDLVGCLDYDPGCGVGFIGLAELDLVLSNWNLTVPPADPRADWSGDGFIGLDDLDYILVRWNSGTPPVSNTSVPEPATGMVLGLASCVWLCRTRRG